jgi:hypothetical protein
MLPAKSNYCTLTQEELQEKIDEYDIKGYRLGSMIASLHISDSIFSEGILWGKKEQVSFKLKTTLN